MAKTCPLLSKACIEARCMFWTRVRGKHPQSGADVDHDDCAVRWLPVLLLENAKEARQTAAAVESSRNDHVGLMGTLIQSFQVAAANALEHKQ